MYMHTSVTLVYRSEGLHGVYCCLWLFSRATYKNTCGVLKVCTGCFAGEDSCIGIYYRRFSREERYSLRVVYKNNKVERLHLLCKLLPILV